MTDIRDPGSGIRDPGIQRFEDEGFEDEGFEDPGFKDQGFRISD